MLLLFNKTIKPLNQFAKKNKQTKEVSVSVFADNFLYHFQQNIFAKLFLSVTQKF